MIKKNRAFLLGLSCLKKWMQGKTTGGAKLLAPGCRHKTGQNWKKKNKQTISCFIWKTPERFKTYEISQCCIMTFFFHKSLVQVSQANKQVPDVLALSSAHDEALGYFSGRSQMKTLTLSAKPSLYPVETHNSQRNFIRLLAAARCLTQGYFPAMHR